MSYDHFFNMDFKEFLKSQSLWNRAMSYDELNEKQRRNQFPVSIPLEQGNVLRLKTSQFVKLLTSLNPFGTGQCLTT